MKRQILVFSGLFVLFLLFGFSSNALATHYKVKNGDSLYSISKKFNVSVNDIKKANNLRKSSIKTNQVLKITKKNGQKSTAKHSGKASYYVVKKGDTLAKIARKTNVSVKQLTALNDINPRRIRAGQKIVLAKANEAPEESIPVEQSETVEASNDSSNVLNEDEYFTRSEEQQNKEEFLGQWNNPDEVESLVKTATGFLGMPYRFGGSSLEGKGIDCSSFVQKIYRMFDITLPRSAREQAKVGIRIPKKDLVEGDLVFFNTYRSFGHVGIYIGNNEFVHASTRGKIVRIDSLDMPFYKRTFQRAVRIKTWDNTDT
jgi:cell wall-associated NlpC family hydrolase